MWELLKYLDILKRLASLFGNLKAVRARDPGTSAADYQPAADVILDDAKVQAWMDKHLSPEEADQFSTGLPTFLFALDAMTE